MIPSSYRWLRFKKQANGQFVSALPSGKVAFADSSGEVAPTAPGHYLAAWINEHERFAVASLIRAHRSLKFSREQAFGMTDEGVSVLFSYRLRKRRKLPFVCRPDKERLELFGYDTFKSLSADGWMRYCLYRHGDWRLRNSRGPKMIPDEIFREVQKRVYQFERGKFGSYSPSASMVWSAAREAGIATDEECEEAYRRNSFLWNYSGD